MKSPPWFRFYPDKFWRDEAVQLLNYRQIGMYLKILSHDWTEGSIPSKWDHVRKLLKVENDEDFAELVELIKGKFEPKGAGRQTHPVQEDSRRQYAKMIEQRQTLGALGGKATAKKRQKAQQKLLEDREGIPPEVAKATPKATAKATPKAIDETQQNAAKAIDESQQTGSDIDIDLDLDPSSKENNYIQDQIFVERGGVGGKVDGASTAPPDRSKGIWFNSAGEIEMATDFADAMAKSYPKLNIDTEQARAGNWNVSQTRSRRKKSAIKFFTNWLNSEQAKVDRLDRIRGSTTGAKGRYNTSSRNLKAAEERQKRFEAEEAQKRRLLEDGKTTKQPDK
jgi:hypothetical protein